MSRSKVFLIFCLAFILGIFLGRFLRMEIMAALAMIFIIIATVGWNNKITKLIGLAGLVLVLGSLRTHFYASQNDLQQFYGQTIEVSGVITEEPDVRNDKTYLTLGHVQIGTKQVKGKVLLNLAQTAEYKYGQKLKIIGKLGKPKDAEAVGEFSYKNYLSRFGIYAVVYYPRVEEAEAGFGTGVKYALLFVKQRFVNVLNLLLPEPQSSFLGALLVGLRRSIPEDLLDAFNITGTTHIIAISGFNIMIIINGLDKFLSRFGRRVSFVLSLLAIIGFVVISGASASVVRAAIMGVLLLIALNIGRLYAMTNALIFTAAVMLLLNPLILHFDVGFQLSFLALLGLVYLSPILKPQLVVGPKWIRGFLGEYLVPTVAAQIFVLPVLLYNFERLSLVAPLTNVLVLLFIPATMLFGFLAGLLGLVWPVLAIPFAAVAWALLTYIIKIAEWTSHIPFASVEIKGFGLPMLTAYYVILIFIIWTETTKSAKISI